MSLIVSALRALDEQTVAPAALPAAPSRARRPVGPLLVLLAVAAAGVGGWAIGGRGGEPRAVVEESAGREAVVPAVAGGSAVERVSPVAVEPVEDGSETSRMNPLPPEAAVAAEVDVASIIAEIKTVPTGPVVESSRMNPLPQAQSQAAVELSRQLQITAAPTQQQSELPVALSQQQTQLTAALPQERSELALVLPPQQPRSAVVAVASPAGGVEANAAFGPASPPSLTVRDRSSVTVAVDERTTRRTIAALTAALQQGDNERARTELAALREQLPARSLTRLRFEAWAALAAGDLAAAETQYQALLDRVPDDLNGGINLALVEARSGRFDAATERLDALTRRHGRLDELQRAQVTLQQLQAGHAAARRLQAADAATPASGPATPPRGAAAAGAMPGAAP